MNINEMTLKEVNERLAQLDEEVRAAQTADVVEKAAEEKRKLIDRKKELEELETRKQTALEISAGTITAKTVDSNAAKEDRATDDKYNTIEYRRAFMEYCRTGKPIDAEYRADAFTSISDAAAVIPTTIMDEIIKEMKQYGQLYSRVRKTNIKGGVQVPILSLKPTARRITESAVSDRQNVTANTYVTFAYYGLECKIATSLLASAVTLASFESSIAPLIAEAMVRQNEIEIIKGTGSGEMLGVTVDTRVPAGNVITLSAEDFTKWDAWKKKVFAKIPLAYRAGGVFVMAAGTFDGYIDGMVDSNGQPVGRVNYGITDGAALRFGGKEVLLVEEDVIESYDAAATGSVVAVYMRPEDYCINSNMQMAMYRWLDHDTNQWVDKAILINDGKLIDPAGVLIIKKGV